MDKVRIGQKLSLSVLLLFVSNLIAITTNGTMGNVFALLVPIVLLIPLLLIKKELPKNLLSWIILGISIPSLIGNDNSNMNGVYLFLFSLSISVKSKKTYVIYSSFFISALLYKFDILNSSPSQIMQYIAGSLFIGIFYQHYIHPKKQSKQYIKNYLDFPSKKYLLDVMELYIQDKTWNEIAEILYPHKTGNSLRKDVKKDITKLEFESYGEFILYLGQNGIIKQVDKNLITE
jgi:uncharacterized membrane protein